MSHMITVLCWFCWVLSCPQADATEEVQEGFGFWPGDEACAPLKDTDWPGYHLKNRHSCQENDPNGPVFDPVHGVIHHFYQDHLAAPGGRGPIYGHFVSKDFVHWAEMPVAIWNGLDSSVWPPRTTSYDTIAIYTGSAAIVEGAGPGGKGPGIVQIYPGLCDKAHYENCTTGTNLAQAVPADYASDELLTNWTKPDYNPIVNGTERDPSTPWKTPSGEWRLRTFDSFYGAASDEDLLKGKWYTIGKNLSEFRQCECPSFYPLPAPTPGFEKEYQDALNSGTLPSHVHKTSCHGDWWQMGTYDPGSPRTTGSFTATPGWEDVYQQRIIDAGQYYASKDNEYPTKAGEKRRINWGWANVAQGSTQSLPRVITFNAATRMLEQAPIGELQALREAPVFTKTDIHLHANSELDLQVDHHVAKQSEVVVNFALPASATTFGIGIGHPNATDAEELGPNIPLSSFCTVKYTTPSNISAPFQELPVSCGAQTRGPSGLNGKDVLRILPQEKTISLRLFLDHVFMEAFFQNGRVAITAPVNTTGSIVAYTSGAPVIVQSVDVYPMRDIWNTPEEVRAMPRVYPIPHAGELLVV